jgi:hypothetical protein
MDKRSIIDNEVTPAWGHQSPFATPPATVLLPQITDEGPVRFLLVSGEKDDARWGIVGAFWLSTDRARGGFLLSPQALWYGREMVRSYRSALSRGWSDDQIFAYWSGQTGILGTYMIDPPSGSNTLADVARFVGAA